MTKEQILKASKPWDVFTKENYKTEFKKLAMEFHPDKHNGDKSFEETMTKLNFLHNEAISYIKLNLWGDSLSNKENFALKDNTSLIIKFLQKDVFELGYCFINKKSIVYYIKNEHKRFYDNFIFNCKSFKFADKTMEEQMIIRLPKIVKTYELKNKDYIIAIEKTEDVFPLRNIVDKKLFNEKSKAWVVSGMCSLLCYLQYLNMVSNGFTIDNIFISPKHHTVMNYGRFFYGKFNKESLIGMKKDLYNVLPNEVKTKKIALYASDIEGMKQISRELYGDKSGSLLGKTIPLDQNIVKFLMSYGGDKEAIEIYKEWLNSLDLVYGKRKFEEIIIKESDVY